MKTFLMAFAAAAAVTVPAVGAAQAQQSQPGTTQQRTDQQDRGIAPEQLKPEQVRQLQQALKDQGYYRGEASGVWGPESASALGRYNAGMPSSARARDTARIYPETLSALGLDPAQFGQADRYLPSGPTGRSGSTGRPPSASPGAPPSSPPGGSPGSR